MLRFLIKSFFIIFIPVVLMTLIMLLAKDDYSAHSNEVNVALAYHRLDSLRNQRKIILIAGSSGSWSTNSQMLVDAFHLPVVNTSCHAGIGVRMQFEMYKQFMKEGDIVVFFPEYYFGLNSLYGESTLFRIISTHAPQEYLHLSLKQWLHNIKYVGIHYFETVRNKNRRVDTGPYSASAVNQYGDIEYERKCQESVISYDNIMGKLDDDAFSYYKYVHDFAKNKGINLIFLPPTLMERNYLKKEAQIDSLSSYLKVNGIPYQAETKRYMFPDSLYYNTTYHMNTMGAATRTTLLIEDIRRITNLCITE